MQKYILIAIVLAITSVLVIGCSSAPTTKPVESIKAPPEPEEKMIWSFPGERPGWTLNEPEGTGNKLFFLGLSGKFAMEKQARNDAHRDAVSKVVGYMGSFVKDKYERLVTTHGLSSEIVDPTNATREFQQQLSEAFATHVKDKSWYIEKWQTKLKETYHKAFVLAEVPKKSIENAYEDALDSQIDDLKKKRDAANEAKAKKQFENAMNAFENAKKQGFGFDK